MNRFMISGLALGISLLVLSCTTDRQAQTRKNSYDCAAWTNAVTDAAQLGEALRHRWSLEAIQTYCRIVEPVPDWAVNFVVADPWQGELYAEQATGFDAIWWKARHENGKLDLYHLCAIKGGKYWAVDAGDAKALATEHK